MDAKRLKTVSKFLSKHLRHDPQGLGLSLEPGGWVKVEDVLAGARAKGFAISGAELQTVIDNNDKKRFALSPDGEKIRANQGHSVEVDLQLEAKEPPEFLYHGTADRNVDSILTTGLDKRNRHHVHLSADTTTALKVGSRHGKPVIFRIDTTSMRRDGFTFYLSENGVWLVAEVPAKYLRLLEPSESRTT